MKVHMKIFVPKSDEIRMADGQFRLFCNEERFDFTTHLMLIVLK
jgi:hypothetical protein